jgi:hypothetical protein
MATISSAPRVSTIKFQYPGTNARISSLI